MWYALWVVILLLVHLQFKYCSTFAVGFLKLTEATLIVAAIKIYTEYDPEQLYDIVEKFSIPV